MFARLFLWLASLGTIGLGTWPSEAFSGELPPPLLLINRPESNASLTASEASGVFHFRVGNGSRQVPKQELVRWSTPRENLDHRELLLADGSQLVLADVWIGSAPLSIQDGLAIATTQLFGKVRLPLKQVRGLLWNAPVSSARRTKLRDRMIGEPTAQDQLYLSKGGILKGSLIGVRTTKTSERLKTFFQFDVGTGTVDIAAQDVVGVAWGTSEKKATGGDLAVGLRDGSLLFASSVMADNEQCLVRLAIGMELSGHDVRDIVFLQSLGPPLVYLSHLDEQQFQHTPYLSLPWPYRRDRNVLGGPLMVAGQKYLNGLAVHSRTRLAYRLPSPSPGIVDAGTSSSKPQHFAAQLAIDDAASGHGSVVFRVQLLTNNSWETMFTSPVVRGGDAPLPISVELGQAEAIALIVDYADHGDERDYANWLDARLE